MPLVALLLATAFAAPAAQAPPGFQTDLAGGVHAECCRGVESNEALPTVNWSCVKGRAIVLFARS